LNYYVYYKVDAARLGELRAAVDAIFASVERECGVRGRWMRRRDDPATFMEVYEGIADSLGFEAFLAGAAKGFPFVRKTECFQCA
jgi:predicted homoserine dehydrogenase-like protein